MATAPGGDAAPKRPPSDRQATVRALSDRLVAAQRPLRVLDAVRWGDDVEHAFFAAGARRLPPVGRDYYADRPLPFDPDGKRRELLDLESDVRRRLGAGHAAGRLLLRRCAECRQVVDLLRVRGTPAFAVLSERLYGGPQDRPRPGGPSLAGLARLFGGGGATGEATLDGETAAAVLRYRLGAYFGDAAVRVRLSGGLAADAAAGGGCLRLRGGVLFTEGDLRLLEVHEGWVHLGTTRNGQAQPACTFLSQGPPSATVTQEGLAVLTEVLAGAAHAARVRRLTNRAAAVALAAAGADFLDVYRFFEADGLPPRDAYRAAVRVFRGSLPRGCGPFTKDLSYCTGFARVLGFVTGAAGGAVARVPLLFCGKTDLDDLPGLAALADEGLLAPPRFVPPPFADLNALAAGLRRSGNGLTGTGSVGDGPV